MNWKRAAAQKNAAVKAEQAEQQAERKIEHTFLHADFHKICSKISEISNFHISLKYSNLGITLCKIVEILRIPEKCC